MRYGAWDACHGYHTQQLVADDFTGGFRSWMEQEQLQVLMLQGTTILLPLV